MGGNEETLRAPPEARQETPSSLSPPRPAARLGSHLRAIGVLLALAVLVTGAAYPAAVTAFAQVTVPYSANGSLLRSANGTLVGSSLLAQNMSSLPWLFWPRPSVSDYNYFLGDPPTPAVVDPVLVNITLSYMAEYGPYAVNATVPLSLVSASGSNVDPDITPEAALVQIPRIANASGLSEATLMAFVLEHVVAPAAGFFGTAYVDVLVLDLALLPIEGR